jgi:hypothetical protein
LRIRQHNGRIALDLVVAYGVVFVCGALIHFLYTPLRKAEGPRNVIAPSIATGEHRSLLMSRGRCVGEISTTLSSDDTPTLETSVKIRTAYQGKTTETAGNFVAYFNPLLQLGRGRGTIEAPLFSLEVSLNDVTPIRVTASARLGQTARSVELTIPGPLSLVRDTANSYRLEYAQLPSTLDGGAAARFVQSAASDLALTIAASENPSAQCPPDRRGEVDLAPLVTKFRPFLQPLTSGEHP